jgi:hypothetical protein
VLESVAVAIAAFSPTQVVLAPSEHGIAYQLTDKEGRRAFFDVMSAIIQDIGYGLALQADTLAVSQLQNSAGNAIVANGVLSSTVASSDGLDATDIINAMKENAKDKFVEHRALLVSPGQMASLMADTAFLTAEKFGSDASANRNGFLGKVFGIPVYLTTQIPIFTATTSNHAKAILISGREPFVYGFKNTGGVRSQYQALLRYTDIVGTIDFDVKIARANSVCTIESYSS